ncbi:putative leucine-rich repeat-containing protein DDB_G0290503 isoform X2 [Watersipora subatra]|uniref:putative leucine-rich repeat-containing protein DDB_G0290503 isoform X2 n=1 Tax=Watersipora subatra TaxID=2589382 RepID=UPI00355BBDBF
MYYEGTERMRSPLRNKDDEIKCFDGRMKTFTQFRREERSFCVAGFFQRCDKEFECHRCKVVIYKHDIDENYRDSWKFHARRSPSCAFVVEVQGQDFIKESTSTEDISNSMVHNNYRPVSGVPLETVLALQKGYASKFKSYDSKFKSMGKQMEDTSFRVTDAEKKVENMEERLSVSAENTRDAHDEMTRRTDHLHTELEQQRNESSQKLSSMQSNMDSFHSYVDTSLESFKESISGTNQKVDDVQRYAIEEVHRLDDNQSSFSTEVNQLMEEVRPNNVSDSIPIPQGRRDSPQDPMLPLVVADYDEYSDMSSSVRSEGSEDTDLELHFNQD